MGTCPFFFFGGGKVGVMGDERNDRGMEVGLRYLHASGRLGDVVEYGLSVFSASSQDIGSVSSKGEGEIAGMCCRSVGMGSGSNRKKEIQRNMKRYKDSQRE